MSTDLALNNQFQAIKDLINSTNELERFFDTEEAFLEFRRRFVTWIMGNDPAIFNITVTSDIIKYNKLEGNPRSLLVGNMIKSVSDKQSFVYNPHN
jgi:hypothetical protein